MRGPALLAASLALAACDGSQTAVFDLHLAQPPCAGPSCRLDFKGHGLLVTSAEPSGVDPLATESGQRIFYGEVRTSTGVTLVVEIAFDNFGDDHRVRYREVQGGRVVFRGTISDQRLDWTASRRRSFHFVATDGDRSKVVEGEIDALTDVVIDERGAPEAGGCGGDDPGPDVVLYFPDYPDHYYPSPDPSPDPPPDPSPTPSQPVSTPPPSDEGCGGSDPQPPSDSGSSCEGDSSTPSSSGSGSSCEGDTTEPSSSGGGSSCEGDSSSSSSSSSASSCEGDSSSSSSSSSSCDGGGSSSSSSSSSCEGDTATAACVPMLPWARIFTVLWRMFGPVSLVGVWNRWRRGLRASGLETASAPGRSSSGAVRLQTRSAGSQNT